MDIVEKLKLVKMEGQSRNGIIVIMAILNYILPHMIMILIGLMEFQNLDHQLTIGMMMHRFLNLIEEY